MSAIIIPYERYRTVAYYTVKCEDNNKEAVREFFRKTLNDKKLVNQAQQMAYWLKRIGEDRHGAVPDLFRFENNCCALPPKQKKAKRMGVNVEVDLRLYCHRVSDKIVILFNGGNKTEYEPQKCPNVRFQFYQAQIWTKALDKIRIEHEGQDILNIDDILLNC